MPITSSAKKALRQNIRRRAQNLARRTAYKEAVKKYKKLITAKKTEEAKDALTKAYRALDKAAKTNVIPKGKASRIKSRLARLVKRPV